MVVTNLSSLLALVCLTASLLGVLPVASAQGTGVVRRPEMDRCRGAFGAVPTDGRPVPGSFVGMTADPTGDINEGFCGVDIGQGTVDTPQNGTSPNAGIWYKIIGTGNRIRASTCDARTDVLVTISVFTLDTNTANPKNKTCDESRLRCVGGAATADFECKSASATSASGGWETISSAFDFDTIEGRTYYVFVQNADSGGREGTIWISFREPNIPQNDLCVDSIGPVPRDSTRILASLVDATKENVKAGVCESNKSLYPGVWFQIMGTGDPITISACSEFNTKGFQLSVYSGATCGSLECVTGGKYVLEESAPDKCTFGPGQITRPLSMYTFDTVDRNRYYVMVHYQKVETAPTTSTFRFYADDGKSGVAGTGGTSSIVFKTGGGLLGPIESDAEIEEEQKKQEEREKRKKERESGARGLSGIGMTSSMAVLFAAALW